MGAQDNERQKIVIVVRDETGNVEPEKAVGKRLEWWFIPLLVALGFAYNIFGK
jgi:hypothetical protein